MAIDHLIAELDNYDQNPLILEELMQIYPDCHQEIQATFNSWKELELIETPKAPERMHLEFYKSLNQLTQNQITDQNTVKHRITSPKFQIRHLYKYAAAILLLVTGVFIGREIGYKNTPTLIANQQVNGAETDSRLIAINDTHSAITRLKGIQSTKQLSNPNNKIFEALNQTLLHDPNINVRLSAIEAMLHFGEHAIIREYLIAAIAFQDSPIVQVALADAMITLNEKRSIEPIQELMQKQQLELDVKRYLANTVKLLL